MDVKFRKGKATEPFEYYCNNCEQLRLAYVDKGNCGNCGSADIIIGKIGELNKAELKRKEEEND